MNIVSGFASKALPALPSQALPVQEARRTSVSESSRLGRFQCVAEQLLRERLRAMLRAWGHSDSAWQAGHFQGLAVE
jgi:hypothetical protein